MTRQRHLRLLLPILAAAVVVVLSAPASAARPPRTSEPPAYRPTIEADWAAQEKRLGREAGSAAAIRAALLHAARLLEDLRTLPDAPDLAADAVAFSTLRQEAEKIDSLDGAGRLALYHKVRWAARDLAFKNPLLAGRPIAFMKRHRFVCQMLHEYIAYFSELGGRYGGSVCVLEQPGQSFRTRDLVKGRLAVGCYSTLALSYDARKLYFAFADCNGDRKSVV
jgi:hypothetical protein